MSKPQVRYFTCADPENVIEGGGSPSDQGGGVQLHTSGVVINLSKWVDHGTDSYFWYMQKSEQDLVILNTWITSVVFSIKPKKVMVEPGTAIVSVRLGRLL